MTRHAQKLNKTAVARRATPEQQVNSCPPADGLKSLSSPRAVLEARHAELKSWDVISWELGRINRGTLSRVASGKREPSARLMSKLNRVYGCHLHAKEVKLTVSVCPVCGETPTPKHKCKLIPPKPRRKFDMTNKEAREIGIKILGVMYGQKN
jgi:hypothetical protein